MAYLNRSIARFELVEFDEAEEAAIPKDNFDPGSLESRLLRCPDVAQTHSQFAANIAKVRALVPETEVAVISPMEISLRLYGLEFARARVAMQPGSFQTGAEIVFGISGFEDILTAENEESFTRFARGIVTSRTSAADKRHPFWRMYPERWLESLIVKTVSAVDSHLDPACVYSQVPAFSASDRSLIDVLTCTREGRLAVLELKADEDMHLPLQGLDYWARVLWHHNRGEFQQHGYFTGIQLSPQPPLLILVAPSLRVHPATDTILRYFSPAIEWM